MTIDVDAIDGVNRHETRFLYDEIFVRRAYLQGGVTLPDDAVVLDIGANIGVYSLFVASVCRAPTIYAFEPVPAVVAKLRRNVAAHGVPATVLPYGLSDADRETEFTYYPGYSTMSTRRDYADTPAEKAFVRQRVIDDGGDGELLEHLDELLDIRFAEVRVRCRLRRLSGVLDELGIGRIDVVKIDVQRAEADVLAGLDDRHWPAVRQLVVEVHDEPGTGTEGRTARLSGELTRRGYAVTALPDAQDRHTLFAVRP